MTLRDTERKRPAVTDASTKNDLQAARLVKLAPGKKESYYVELADLLFDLMHYEKDEKSSPLQVPQKTTATLKERDVDSTLIGVLARCAIEGCDVHKLTYPDFDIIEHYPEDEAVPEIFTEARTRINAMPQNTVAVLIFNDHMLFLRIDGTFSTG